MTDLTNSVTLSKEKNQKLEKTNTKLMKCIYNRKELLKNGRVNLRKRLKLMRNILISKSEKLNV